MLPSGFLLLGSGAGKSGNPLGHLRGIEMATHENFPCPVGRCHVETGGGTDLLQSPSPVIAVRKEGRLNSHTPTLPVQGSFLSHSFQVVQKYLWDLWVLPLSLFHKTSLKSSQGEQGVVDNVFSSGYKTAVHFLSSWGSNLEGIHLDSKVSGPLPSSFLPNLLPSFVTGWPACRRRAKPRHQGGVRP